MNSDHSDGNSAAPTQTQRQISVVVLAQHRRIDCTLVEMNVHGALVLPPVRAQQGLAMRVLIPTLETMQPLNVEASLVQECEHDGHYCWQIRFLNVSAELKSQLSALLNRDGSQVGASSVDSMHGYSTRIDGGTYVVRSEGQAHLREVVASPKTLKSDHSKSSSDPQQLDLRRKQAAEQLKRAAQSSMNALRGSSVPDDLRGSSPVQTVRASSPQVRSSDSSANIENLLNSVRTRSAASSSSTTNGQVPGVAPAKPQRAKRSTIDVLAETAQKEFVESMERLTAGKTSSKRKSWFKK